MEKKDHFFKTLFNGFHLTKAFAGFVPLTINIILSRQQPLYTMWGEVVAQVASFFMMAVVFVYMPAVLLYALYKPKEFFKPEDEKNKDQLKEKKDQLD